MASDRLLIGTRKGLVTYRRDGDSWAFERIAHLGHPVVYAIYDSRTGKTWASLDHGHWGQKLHVSSDDGETWEEVAAPAYPEGEVVKDRTRDGAEVPATTRYIWVIQPGPASEPETLYVGTEPGGLFVTRDGGASFELVSGLWNHPSRLDGWFGGGRDMAAIHSIWLDPADSNRVLVAISCAGVFETLDGGASWHPMNKGLQADFLPDKDSEVGQDPHILAVSPSDPLVMWQQNHCGIYVSRDGSKSWNMVSEDGGPAHFGFAVAVHPTKPGTAWVVPALSDERRVAIDGAVCVCRTDDFGASWTAQRNGLPQHNAHDLTYRHALDVSDETLVFGTTSGNLYVSADGGEAWTALSNNLAPVYSVRFG
ncbi:MAG: hypothetical protein KC561_05225 [Myxococcales bacterium]|nr:hypothetical protein [Myxococcales bacterium]